MKHKLRPRHTIKEIVAYKELIKNLVRGLKKPYKKVHGEILWALG